MPSYVVLIRTRQYRAQLLPATTPKSDRQIRGEVRAQKPQGARGEANVVQEMRFRQYRQFRERDRDSFSRPQWLESTDRLGLSRSGGLLPLWIL